MMGVETTTGLLPFAVQGPSPERVQLWGQFASQASSKDDMNMASWAFEAFWWECQMATSYDNVVRLLHDGVLEYAVRWMDSLLFEATLAVEEWQRILEPMASHELIPAAYQSCLHDANQQLAALGQLVQQVTGFGLAFCEQWGLLVPEHLLAMRNVLLQG